MSANEQIPVFPLSSPALTGEPAQLNVLLNAPASQAPYPAIKIFHRGRDYPRSRNVFHDGSDSAYSAARTPQEETFHESDPSASSYWHSRHRRLAGDRREPQAGGGPRHGHRQSTDR